ncbi:MAG: hypothetical protein ACREOK_08870 [Gemmatimonadaceae bacterium]
MIQGSKARGRHLALAILAGAMTLMSGCIHISQRAIDNGRSMTNSLQYRQVMSGDRSMSSLKRLYYRADARLLHHRDIRYPLFGSW